RTKHLGLGNICHPDSAAIEEGAAHGRAPTSVVYPCWHARSYFNSICGSALRKLRVPFHVPFVSFLGFDSETP
ncbi:MAG: hypothetical protein ACKPKO_23035, partial [Candidatus Fonsibacter sp.]